MTFARRKVKLTQGVAMKAFATIVLACLVACGGATSGQPEPSSDAGSTETQPPDAAADGQAEDPYAFACCHFANEGLSEYDACCAKWRAEHNGKDSL